MAATIRRADIPAGVLTQVRSAQGGAQGSVLTQVRLGGCTGGVRRCAEGVRACAGRVAGPSWGAHVECRMHVLWSVHSHAHANIPITVRACDIQHAHTRTLGPGAAAPALNDDGGDGDGVEPVCTG